MFLQNEIIIKLSPLQGVYKVHSMIKICGDWIKTCLLMNFLYWCQWVFFCLFFFLGGGGVFFKNLLKHLFQSFCSILMLKCRCSSPCTFINYNILHLKHHLPYLLVSTIMYGPSNYIHLHWYFYSWNDYFSFSSDGAFLM